MNLCRLCGEEKSPLDFNVELNDRTSSSWSYRELVEHHTRVELKTNKLLPQSICEECRGQIDGFADFTQKLQAVQDTLDVGEEEIDDRKAEECIELKYFELHEDEIPLKKRARRTSYRVEELEDYRSNFAGIPPLKFQLDLTDEDISSTGEVDGSALQHLNLTRWSEFARGCDLCDDSVFNLCELSSHHAAVHSPGENEIVCSVCPMKFKRIFGFINHVTSKHEEHLKHCCLVCDKFYVNLELLHQHLTASHVVESKEIFQCPACGQFRDSSSTLCKHFSSMHPKVPETVKTRRRTAALASSRSSRLGTVIKAEARSESNEDFGESGSELRDYSEMKPKRTRRELKQVVRKKNSQIVSFGEDVNTFEKLYESELNGTSSAMTSLHLNISEFSQLSNGEIPDEQAMKVSTMRWRDLLSCAICNVSYANIEKLLEHADATHTSRAKLFHCQECKCEFTAFSALINHFVERHHYEHLKFCCLICSKMFFNLPTLMNHYKSHKGRFEVLVCLICGWYSKNLEDLKEHKSVHMSTEKSENQLLCDQVFEKFNSGVEPSTRNHCVAEFERNPDGSVTEDCQARSAIDWSFGVYNCPTCLTTHSNPFELFVHQRLMHPREVLKKIYTCKLCTDKKDFSNLFTYINHATSKHLDNAAKFTCVACTRVFWNYLALAKHYKDVHPTFPCVFCCHCGKIFMNVTVASSHFKALNLLRTPEERRLLKEGKILEDTSHICHVCARSFKSRGTLLNHVKTHEALEPSELMQCHICKKFYKNKYKLAQHMVCHEDLRSWKCKACGQAFNYKKLLQRHIQAVHENERQFGCTFCDKRFNSKYDLTVHVRLHTGEFPYECPIAECDAKYPAWSNLFKHCQSRHKLDIRSDGYKKLRATQKLQKTSEDFESD